MYVCMYVCMYEDCHEWVDYLRWSRYRLLNRQSTIRATPFRRPRRRAHLTQTNKQTNRIKNLFREQALASSRPAMYLSCQIPKVRYVPINQSILDLPIKHTFLPLFHTLGIIGKQKCISAPRTAINASDKYPSPSSHHAPVPIPAKSLCYLSPARSRCCPSIKS